MRDEMGVVPFIGSTGGTGGFVKSEQTGASEKEWPLFFAVARIVIRIIPIVVFLFDLWLIGKKAWVVSGVILLACRLRFRRPIVVQLPSQGKTWRPGMQRLWLWFARRPRLHFSPAWLEGDPKRAVRLKRLWWAGVAVTVGLAILAMVNWWIGGDWLLSYSDGETYCEIVNDVQECTLYRFAGGRQWYLDYAFDFRWPWQEFAKTHYVRLSGFLIMLRFVMIPVLPWLFWTVLTDLEMVYRIESFWKNYRDVMFKPADVSSVTTPIGTLKAAAPTRQEVSEAALAEQLIPTAQVMSGTVGGSNTTRLA